MNKTALAWIIAVVTLSATQALAITRTIECPATTAGDVHLTIQLRAGVAYLFTCQVAPCTNLEADAIATLKRDHSLEYDVNSSSLNFVQRSLRVEFSDQLGGPVLVWLDGDSSRYSSCY